MVSTLKESAESFEGNKTRNITELKTIDVNMALFEQTGKDVNGDEYTYKYIEVNDIKYRVPDSVLSSLKEILKKKADLKTFSVSKTGEGKNTKYTVIPL